MQLAEVVTSLDSYRERRQELRQSNSLPTGSIGLDSALGGGWRKGRIAELFGDYSTHKSSLALHTVAKAQKLGRVLWCDPASDFNPVAARKAGVDLKNLILFRPDGAYELLETMIELASATSLIVVDRATGLEADDEAYWYDQAFGWLKSDLITSAAVFITDQEKQADNPFITALRQWSTQRVALYPAGKLDVEAVVVKNQLAPPSIFDIKLRFEDGYLDDIYELVRLGVGTGVLEKRGSWYYYQGLKIGQGIDESVRALRHDILRHHIRDTVQDRLA